MDGRREYVIVFEDEVDDLAAYAVGSDSARQAEALAVFRSLFEPPSGKGLT